MVRRAVGDEADCGFPEVEAWVRTHLPAGYDWPGNYRELEQCVRNVIIRGSYRPIADPEAPGEDSFLARLRKGELKSDEVISYYAALVYRKTGSYEETGRRLGLDRRTVKTRVEAFLANATEQGASG